MKPFLTSILLFFTACLFAQDTYTITGRVNAPSPKGRVYVFLCDRETFETPFNGVDTISYWVYFDKTHVEYEFKNIPEGEYAIRSFQDVNGNHKLDKWLFGPREPWGYSYTGRMKFPPAFDDVSFQLVQDIRINITLGK